MISDYFDCSTCESDVDPMAALPECAACRDAECETCMDESRACVPCK